MTENIKFANYMTEVSCKARREIENEIKENLAATGIGIPSRIHDEIIRGALKAGNSVIIYDPTQVELSKLGLLVRQGFGINLYLDEDKFLCLKIYWSWKSRDE